MAIGTVTGLRFPYSRVPTVISSKSDAAPPEGFDDLESGRSPGPHRVLVIEDDGLVRRSYRRVLTHAGYEMVEAESIAAARIALTGSTDFHAALVDYNLPDGTATEIVQELVERRPLCRSTVVTGAADVQVASEAARAGAHIYLRKPNTAPEILTAVARTVRSTLEWRDALRHSMPAVGPSETPVPVEFDLGAAVARLRYLGDLSPAATLTAWRMLWGDSNRRIAALMNTSARTVKYHVAEVLSRTGARNRANLLRVLLEDAGRADPWAAREDVPADADSVDEDAGDR